MPFAVQQQGREIDSSHPTTVEEVWCTRFRLGYSHIIPQPDFHLLQRGAKMFLHSFCQGSSVMAVGLCVGCPTLAGRRKAGNLKMQGFFYSFAPHCRQKYSLRFIFLSDHDSTRHLYFLTPPTITRLRRETSYHRAGAIIPE